MRERLFKLYLNNVTQGTYPFVDCIIPFFPAQGKQIMFTVKNFYGKVEASYKFAYTEN